MRAAHACLLWIHVKLYGRASPLNRHACWLLQEIGGYAWHKVADLPATRDEGNQTFLSEDGIKHKFFMVRHAVLQLLEQCLG
jgi:hypothetical protein